MFHPWNRIDIGGIITEGTNQGYIETLPAAYNVVLEDDTYKGQIKIGFKFIANVSMSFFCFFVLKWVKLIVCIYANKRIGVTQCREKSMWWGIKNPLLRRKNQTIQFGDTFGEHHGGSFCFPITKRLIPKINERRIKIRLLLFSPISFSRSYSDFKIQNVLSVFEVFMLLIWTTKGARNQ